jgi:hypothetical protein
VRRFRRRRWFYAVEAAPAASTQFSKPLISWSNTCRVLHFNDDSLGLQLDVFDYFALGVLLIYNRVMSRINFLF